MHIKWIEDIAEFRTIAGPWDKSVLLCGHDNPFLLSDFILTWWKYYSYGKKLMVWSLQDGGNIIAGIPLCEVRRYFRPNLVYVGGYAANITQFFSLAPAGDIYPTFFRSLWKKKHWHLLTLDRVSADDPLLSFARKYFRNDSENAQRCFVLDAGVNGIVDLTNGYESVIAGVPGRLRRYLKAARRELGVGLKLWKISGKSAVEELFEEYCELSKKSFISRRGSSVFEKVEYRKFFLELLLVFDERRRLDAHRLCAGDKTLGISFGYRLGKGFKWILTAFNSEYSRFRPGHLLIDELLKAAASNGDPYFDMFYGGELLYKRLWCNRQVPLKRILVVRNNVVDWLPIWLENTLRSNPTFMKWVRQTKKLVGSKNLGLASSASSASLGRS